MLEGNAAMRPVGPTQQRCVGEHAVAAFHGGPVQGQHANCFNTVEPAFPHSQLVDIGRRWTEVFYISIFGLVLPVSNAGMSFQLGAVGHVNGCGADVVNSNTTSADRAVCPCCR